MERITATELQHLAAERNQAEAEAMAAWKAKNAACRIRDEAIKDLPEQVAFRQADEHWYELQVKADKLDEQWQKAVAAMTEAATK